jgi:hypothetical protein
MVSKNDPQPGHDSSGKFLGVGFWQAVVGGLVVSGLLAVGGLAVRSCSSTPSNNDVSQSGSASTTAPPVTLAQSSSGCYITVIDPLTQIVSAPSPALSSGFPAAEGRYQALANRMVNWGGSITRWFEISVDGRTGWVPNDGIQIRISAGCPS